MTKVGFDGPDIEDAAKDVLDPSSPHYNNVESAAAHWGLWT